MLSEPGYVGANAVLDDVEMFDASFSASRLAKQIAIPAPSVSGMRLGASRNRRLRTHVVRAGSAFTPAPDSARHLLNNLGPGRDLIKSVSDFQILMGNNRTMCPPSVLQVEPEGSQRQCEHRLLTSLVAVHIACRACWITTAT
jgi:hypothetical protein